MNTSLPVIARLAVKWLREGWDAGRSRHTIADMTAPADNPALDRSPVPRQACGRCGSPEWQELAGMRACGECGNRWAAGT